MSDAITVRAIIEQLNARVCDAYVSRNVDVIADAFTEDCWQMPPHAEPLAGRAALREFWNQALQWGEWRFTLETQDIVVSGPVAVERGKYILKFTAGAAAPAGLASMEDRGNYVVMWRKEPDGQWRAVWDAPVSTVPMAMTSASGAV